MVGICHGGNMPVGHDHDDDDDDDGDDDEPADEVVLLWGREEGEGLNNKHQCHLDYNLSHSQYWSFSFSIIIFLIFCYDDQPG